MATEKPTLLIRVHPSTKDALRKAALAEERSMAFISEKAIDDWLREHRYLPKAHQTPRS